MSDAYTINNNQEAIRELYSIRSCFKPISVQYQSLSMGIEALQMVDELPNSEVFIPKSVIEDIKAEIEEHYGDCAICEYFEDFDYEENDISEYRAVGNISDILQIIDKYRAESEDKE